MEPVLNIWPWLVAMLVLIACSAFFSGSEAAMFYLRPKDLHLFDRGGTGQRIAAGLLADSDRLLTAVLFWNLVINVTYFAIVSIVALRLGDDPAGGNALAAGFSFIALLTIIFLSEMLPKSVAVLRPRRIAGVVSIPLAMAVRALDPLLPMLRTINLLSRRLIWPEFETEPYIEVSDLERAIELSTTDAALVEQEQRVLHNIVQLSETRVDELMRPRLQFLTFRPPVVIDDFKDRDPPSGYLLITEPDSDEVASALSLNDLSDVPARLDHKAEPVLYVPWSTSAADALDQMESRDREVAAVVNEHGETIGILTYEDILDTIFSSRPTSSDRLLNRRAIHQVRPGLWQVTSITSLRRLSRYFEVELPPTQSVTVAGMMQEVLQRLPETGDECDWGPFHFRVLNAPQRGQMLLQLTRAHEEPAT